MEFTFLKIVLTGLIVLASATIKIVNAEPILTTVEWEATCYDCSGQIGVRPTDPGQYTTAHATLTLKDFGSDINGDPIPNGMWDTSNFVSFAYSADSDHVYDFLINSSSFEKSPVDNAYGNITSTDDFNIHIEWTNFANLVEKAAGYSGSQQHKYSFDSVYNRSEDMYTWNIWREAADAETHNQELDFGRARVSVTAPPSIFIFALGLMGLSLRRSNKQV
ncbi:MAG: hypothetical protein ACI88A_004800 [Paraglaciecola sp.]|jgi:hypothetical protein